MFRSTRCSLALLAILIAPLAACTRTDPTAPDVAARQATTPERGSSLVTTIVPIDTASAGQGTASRIATGSRTLCDATQPWWFC